ncbi:MAG: hypothetical protein M1834_004910 [Cirrosporium novae-zelandiae]|nr:MAG: hypothetical protein M1834_004910 [Cirrosporium novae-zelandiae]
MVVGIHLEFCRIAHAKGAKVIIADLCLTKEAEDFIQPGVVFQPCDVGKWDDLQNLITVSEKLFQDVPDVYVAGAGIFEPTWSNFWNNTEDDRYAIVDINVNHPIKLTRIAMKALLSKSKKGVVAIMSSIAGYTGIYATPLYSATKHALVGFTRSMADADAVEGIKVVAICPGIVRTPLWTSRPEVMERYGYDDSIAISSEEVAEGIAHVIEDGKYGGGTVFEMSKLGTRVIPLWNISPPGGDAENMVEGSKVPQEALDRVYQPIQAILSKERGVPFSST